MAIFTESNQSIYMTAPAVLFNDERDVASDWASKYITKNKAYKWILAKYVEADNANSNGQYWSLEDLQQKFYTIRNSPMNVGHKQGDIVGTWSGADLIYPTEEDSASNPFVETVGPIWRYYFPELMKAVEQAFDTGTLAVSMECQGDTITCVGDEGCGQEFAYEGPTSESYCQHLQDRVSDRKINNPHFLAGAIILPPDRPGWNKAMVKDMSKRHSDEENQETLRSIASEAPHLSSLECEEMMKNIQMHAYINDMSKKFKEYVNDKDKTPASLIGLRVASDFMSKAYQ